MSSKFAVFSMQLVVLLVCLLAVEIVASGDDDHAAPVSRSNKTNKSIYLPLIDYLKQGYNPLAMPVCDKNSKMHVFMDMWLYQLFDLDEPTQLLTIDVWMEMSWFDCMLTWDPTKFNGINQVTMPAAEIYNPDLIWYQSLHGNFEEGMFLFPQSVARIRSTGMVQLGAQALLKSFCRVDIRKFPYDTQKCNLTFASWNKDSTVFNLTKKDTKESQGHSFKNASNGEWEVLGFPAFDGLSSYKLGSDEDGNGSLIAEVTFQLTLQRKPTYIKVYLIFPCVLLVWVSALTFMLPVECGEKISLCITILLSVIVFLLLVSENIPRTSDGVPTLGIFFCTSIGLVCLSVIMTAIVLNIAERPQDTPVSSCLIALLHSPVTLILGFRYRNYTGGSKWISVRSQYHEKDTSVLQQQSSEEDGECRATNNWRLLAMLLDRLFLVIYLMLALLNTIYIYTQEPSMNTFKGHVSGH